MNLVGNRESKLLNAYILHLTDLHPILFKSNHSQQSNFFAKSIKLSLKSKHVFFSELV